MVSLEAIKAQLASAGYVSSFWSRSEIKELCNVIHDEEQIISAVNGYYEGGFALLVGTDHRLILVDRKPLFLTLDTIAYNTIQEVSLNYRLLNSSINIYTSNKCMVFRSWNHANLRAILMYTQKRIIESRSSQPGFQPMQQPAPQPAPTAPAPVADDTSAGSFSTTPSTATQTSVPSVTEDDLPADFKLAMATGRTTYDRRPIFSRYKSAKRYI